MAIIPFIENRSDADNAYLAIYPDQFVSDKEKDKEDWWKWNLDYFYNVGIQQYRKNFSLVKNYRLIKGILTKEDFYEEPTTKGFAEQLVDDEELPAYVKHYSILGPPIHTVLGELSKKIDNFFVKAFDDDSKSEEGQFRTKIMQDYIMQEVRMRVAEQLTKEGIEPPPMEEFEKITSEQANEYMQSYTSIAEQWGARILDFMKVRFNMKEKLEDGFRDLLICAREFYHIYEDNSTLGFGVETLNPRNVWYIKTPNKKYISDPYDDSNGAYASGTVEIMEFSEILNKFNLTEEEIEHLKELTEDNTLISGRESNLVNGKSRSGPYSVEYDTYDPLIWDEKQIAESLLGETDMFTDVSSVRSSFGNKFVVLKAYWCGKKKIGKLKYIDKEGIENVDYVDDSYKKGAHPKEVSIEWTWINQWYEGIKIGTDIYYVKPIDYINYCPIIGTFHEGKNVEEPKSLVDMMKPYQILFDVCMNQLFQLLEKDMGVVFLMNMRHIPVDKDTPFEDAIEIWEETARSKGVVFVDDSPENARVPSNFNQFSAQNLSRANEIQARLNLALQIQAECWKLVGISEQRQGQIGKNETATGVNVALNQSYSQTEPYFTTHEYCVNKLYQAMLDVAQYKQSFEENSILSSIGNEGENIWLKINGSDLHLKDLGVLVTNRVEDTQNYQELKSLAQAMLQNGASPYEITELYSTKSIRKMKKVFKDLKDKQERFQQTQQQIEQQQIEQQQQQFEQAQQLAQLEKEKDRAFEAYQNEQDRINKLEVVYLQSENKEQSSGTNFESEREKAYLDYNKKYSEFVNKQKEILSSHAIKSKELDIQKEKLDVERKKIDTQLQIAKENKNKYDGKK